MTKTRPKKKPTRATSTLLPASVSELQKLRIFREMPNQALALLDGNLKRVSVDPGETILELDQDPMPFGHFFFLTRGQVKLTGYDHEVRIRPLNFLRKGEFFVDKSIAWNTQVVTRAVAITAADLLVIPREVIAKMMRAHPQFEKKIRELSEKVDYRNRVFSEDPYASSVLEFLIEKDLTQASRVKITQLDRCIACDTCYKSCEDRHGFQRLSRGYARFGTLDFAQSCLTCFYPTCIPSCPVDSVIYNSETSEVEILDACIGCSACARACQFGAIRMHKVDENAPQFARFLSPGKEIKPKFVADKCNHCEGYEDMACITNCPTGAIIEINATELLENPTIFGVQKDHQANALPDLIQRSFLEKTLQAFYLASGFVLTLWLFWEAYALQKFPNFSPLIQLQTMGYISKEFPLTFHRGSPYCVFLGNVGFMLILLALTYPLRKVFPSLFRYFGKAPAWLDFHNFAGAMGTIFVFFHTGFEFPLQMSTLGFVALLVLVLSGVMGRFLWQMIPRSVAGTELRMRDIEIENQSITKKLEALFEDSRDFESLRAHIDRVMEPGKSKWLFWELFKVFLRSKILLLSLRFRLPKNLKIHRKQLDSFKALVKKKVRLQRNITFLQFSSTLFRKWKLVHRPFAYVMSLIVLGHIIYNLLYFSFR